MAELRRAISSAGPGDTIIMADRRWRDADIDFAAVGEPGRPITLRAQTPGKVVLCGRSRVHVGGRHLVVSGLRFADGRLSRKKESVISIIG